jgi:hypothetical protein
MRLDHVPAGELDEQSQSRDTDSSASPVQSLVEQPLHNQPLSELSPIEHPHQSPAGNSSPMVLPEEPMPPVSEGLPQASEERPGESEICKTEEIEPIPQDGASRPPDNLLEVTATERWIPPALLAAWKRGNRQHKYLLAGIAAACSVIFALILTLAVAQVDSSLGRSSGSGSWQQFTARPAVSSVSVDSLRTDPLQAPPALQTPDQPQSDQPQTSPL